MRPKGGSYYSDKNDDSPYRGAHSRGYLPHIDLPELEQFVTFRLADSVPRELIKSWEFELRHLVAEENSAELRERTDTYADQGRGSCALRRNDCATELVSVLHGFDGQLYKSDAFVVMPNHVHMLATPRLGNSLTEIMRRVKGSSYYRLNLLLGKSGRLWEKDYFDRYIRNDKHRQRVMDYIHYNPVHAGLCQEPGDWPYSSAFGAPS